MVPVLAVRSILAVRTVYGLGQFGGVPSDTVRFTRFRFGSTVLAVRTVYVLGQFGAVPVDTIRFTMFGFGSRPP